MTASPSANRALYTAAQRARRDRSRWTWVQGVLAPLQFLAFLISLYFVIRCLMTGQGAVAATVSIIIKTAFLYAIMVTGALWEKDVFGRYLFAPAFFWEDLVSMAVIALHTAYLVVLFGQWLTLTQQLWLAMIAYALYVINAAQFLWKFRQARLATPAPQAIQSPAESVA